MTKRPYERLEEALTAWTDQKPVAVVNSGTSALHLALHSLGVFGQGYVAVPNFCFYAVPRAVEMAGFTPVLIGCDETGLMDIPTLRKAMKHVQLDAIVAVHTYGRMLDMSALHGVAGDVPVIEDFAECHGRMPHNKTFASTWSFQESKLVHGEEGGAVSFADEELTAQARLLRSFNHTGDYCHGFDGWNYRLADALAEPILKSFANYSATACAQWEMWYRYQKECPMGWRWTAPPHSPWMFAMRVPELTDLHQAMLVSAIPGMRYGFKLLSELDQYKHKCIKFDDGLMVEDHKIVAMNLRKYCEGWVESARAVVRGSNPRP